MSEENQTPQPQWVMELKKWGIDVEAFDEQWEKAGDNAKAQFQKALENAKTEYQSEKSAFEAKMDEVREDIEEVFQQMDSAWDEMVANIQEQLNPSSQDDEKDA